MRYTEHIISVTPKSKEGWLKLILTYIMVAPIRLVSEISQKVVFVGKAGILFVLRCAMGLDVVFTVTGLAGLGKGTRMFVPVPILLISVGVLYFLYFRVSRTPDSPYEIIHEHEDEEEAARLVYDPHEARAFDKVVAAPMTFSESINIFITDPDELLAMGIGAETYDAASEARMANAVGK